MTRTSNRLALLALCLLAPSLVACDGSSPNHDAGPRPDGAPSGDFEVRVGHRGEPFEASGDERDDLHVEFGCQGGAHLDLDVRVLAGERLEDAYGSVELEGGPYPMYPSLGLQPTDDGAEAIARSVLFDTGLGLVTPASFDFPRPATLRVTVTHDGESVTATHAVTLIEGGGCTCVHTDPIPGTAVVDAFTVTGDATGCELVQVGVDLTFSTDDPNAHLFYEPLTHHDFEWPAQCVDGLGLAPGSELALDVLDAYPGTICDPPSIFAGPARAGSGCGCPEE